MYLVSVNDGAQWICFVSPFFVQGAKVKVKSKFINRSTK